VAGAAAGAFWRQGMARHATIMAANCSLHAGCSRCDVLQLSGRALCRTAGGIFKRLTWADPVCRAPLQHHCWFADTWFRLSPSARRHLRVTRLRLASAWRGANYSEGAGICFTTQRRLLSPSSGYATGHAGNVAVWRFGGSDRRGSPGWRRFLGILRTAFRLSSAYLLCWRLLCWRWTTARHVALRGCACRSFLRWNCQPPPNLRRTFAFFWLSHAEPWRPVLPAGLLFGALQTAEEKKKKKKTLLCRGLCNLATRYRGTRRFAALAGSISS